MAVGMNEIARSYGHPGDANFTAKTVGMNESMRRPDRAGQRLEARRPWPDIADRAVGDDPQTAERLVDIALHLAPERPETDVGAVHILNHADARPGTAADIFVIRDASRLLFGGRQV